MLPLWASFSVDKYFWLLFSFWVVSIATRQGAFVITKTLKPLMDYFDFRLKNSIKWNENSKNHTELLTGACVKIEVILDAYKSPDKKCIKKELLA